MRITNLCAGSEIYTSNAYRCTREVGEGTGGCSNTDDGCGILIDTGCDPAILTLLRDIERREARQPVCQVVLTHSHYDHAKMLNGIRDLWSVKTFAFSAYVAGVDQIIKGGETIKGGGYIFDLIHVPGHSTDSLCIYCDEEKILFSGDTPLVIWGTEGTYELPFVRAFEILAGLDVQCIYPGHGDPIMNDCNRILDQSLRNLRKSRLI